MTSETLLALLIFANVATLSPGPNNFMLLASGANFGFTRTVPHILGVLLGFLSLLLGIALGLGALLSAVPELELVVKIAGAAYLLYLAWKIAGARALGEAAVDEEARPLTFIQAASFQWVNPKGWVMGLSGLAVYTDTASPLWSGIAVATLFVVFSIPAPIVWAAFGQSLRAFLRDERRMRIFNIVMGVALALTVLPMVA